MTHYTFRAMTGRAEHTFTCPSCGKANRKRTFRVEHTINPFNTNADGSVKTASEVYAGARADAILERDQFAVEPLCRFCEDALPSAERYALWERRKVAISFAGLDAAIAECAKPLPRHA